MVQIVYYGTKAAAIADGSPIAQTIGSGIVGSSPTDITNSNLFNSITVWKIYTVASNPSAPFDISQTFANGINISTTSINGTVYGDDTYFLYPAVVTITYYETAADAAADTNSIAFQYDTLVVNDTANLTITNSTVYNRFAVWTSPGINHSFDNGETIDYVTLNITPPIKLYPYQIIYFSANLTDAINEDYETEIYVSILTTEMINGNNISSWRIGSYTTQQAKNTLITNVPTGIYNTGDNLYSVLNTFYQIYVYPAVNTAAVITYYTTFSDAVNLSNAIADQEGYVINTSTNIYDSVAYFATRLWRIARYRPESNPNGWEAGPPNVYKIGDDLSSIGSDLIFTLYPVVPCLLEGTNILCEVDGQEVYAPIESLRKGALVKTTNGEFKRIELIAKGPFKNPGHSDRIEERLYKCSRSKYPELKKDLYITGCHSILVEGLTDEQREQTLKISYDIFVTDAMYRLMTCLDDRAEPWTSEGEYTVWHLALENEDPKMNYGIYANGLLVESCAINFLKNRTNMTIV